MPLDLSLESASLFFHGDIFETSSLKHWNLNKGYCLGYVKKYSYCIIFDAKGSFFNTFIPISFLHLLFRIQRENPNLSNILFLYFKWAHVSQKARHCKVPNMLHWLYQCHCYLPDFKHALRNQSFLIESFEENTWKQILKKYSLYSVCCRISIQ